LFFLFFFFFVLFWFSPYRDSADQALRIVLLLSRMGVVEGCDPHSPILVLSALQNSWLFMTPCYFYAFGRKQKKNNKTKNKKKGEKKGRKGKKKKNKKNKRNLFFFSPRFFGSLLILTDAHYRSRELHYCSPGWVVVEGCDPHSATLVLSALQISWLFMTLYSLYVFWEKDNKKKKTT
jgi:hypothetical protein